LADFVAEIGIPTARDGWCIVFDAPTSAWRMAREASTSMMMPTFTSIR
jgi:hypothetical protein